MRTQDARCCVCIHGVSGGVAALSRCGFRSGRYLEVKILAKKRWGPSQPVLLSGVLTNNSVLTQYLLELSACEHNNFSRHFSYSNRCICVDFVTIEKLLPFAEDRILGH